MLSSPAELRSRTARRATLRAVSPALLRLIFATDRARFALFRRRFGARLCAAAGTSPNLRLSDVALEPGARLELGPGFATERRAGNRIRVERDGLLRLGARTWLRSEYGTNYLTAHRGARLEVGDDALINGAMLHAKREIVIGNSCWLGFGARVLDADLHDLDAETPQRIEPVRIGDRVWLGAQALVLRGVSIGDDVVVAAGAVVTSDLPSRCLAAGVPARPIRELASRQSCT